MHGLDHNSAGWETTDLLPPPARIHFVGIGGIGMSGLARILNAWGYVVSGSDAAASPLLDQLAAEGIAVTVGHGAVDRAAASDLLVVTGAIPPGNPEVVAAHSAGKPIVKRAALLGAIAARRRCMAVAGSHGKSTTSGMLATALRTLGADPSYAVGAVLAATGTNAAPGSGPDFVVEADEYDYSFLQLAPDVAVITNIDYDHPDLFPTVAAYDDAFRRFVERIRSGGTLVIAGDDPGCTRLRGRTDVRWPDRVVTFGEAVGCEWRLEARDDRGDWVVAAPGHGMLTLRLAVPGTHNARNALAALAVLSALGYEPEAAAAALATFGGIGRRFEIKGEAAGVTVIDDYAHHPSEIRATLRAARERYPGRTLWAAFQPHTFSRLKALVPDFADALGEADRCLILDVYAARETDSLGIGATDLRALLPPDALAATDPAAAADLLAEHVNPGDVVLTLGAGSVTETGPLLLERLRRGLDPGNRPPSPAPPPSAGEGRRSALPSPTIPDRPNLRVLRESPMSLHTTWRVGGPADLLVRAPTPADLRAAVAWGHDQGLPVTVIGGGSNLLVGDGGIRGLVVLARTPGERATGLLQADDHGDHVELRVAAQAPLSWTGRHAAERGWSGLDWGVGLPGTIGGATVNNAGAHGVEQKDHLERVVVLDDRGRVAEHPAAWLEAAYRHTSIKATPRPRPWVVLEVLLRLPKGDPAELVRRAEDHARFRKETQPTGACAGSTFANPPGDFAGRLLEAAGLRGFRVGGAAFSPKHSNWIVNDGGATAAQVRELIATARDRVRDRFGVELRTEIEEIGEA